MKKTHKLLAILMIACMALCVAACDLGGGPEEKHVQGVDTVNHVIKIGNTAATTGAFASVGVPFNYAQEAYLWYYQTQTEGYSDASGNKYGFEFVHYDDGFNGSTGYTYTQKLVEDDEVFALVGHFGSNTVAATVDYIEEQGIPMVYGVCGVSELYETERNIMTVQPIYETEGRSMLATAYAPVEAGGLGGTKVGVIYTTDDAGFGMLAGIREEEKALAKNVVYQSTAADATDDAAQVAALKAAGCDVVVIAANQAPFIRISGAFISQNYDNVKIITSYVSANAAAMGGLVTSGVITETREVYAGAWLVTGSLPAETKGWKDFVEFVKVMTLYDKAHNIPLLPSVMMDNGAGGQYDLLDVYFGTLNMETFQYDRFDWAADGVSANFLNSYAMAGYVSANVFCQGLTRMNGKDLNWEDFISAMEEDIINVPMGTAVSYVDGQRIGIDALALNKYSPADAAAGGSVYRGITGLAELEAAIRG